jgi:hypothetical protein
MMDVLQLVSFSAMICDDTCYLELSTNMVMKPLFWLAGI